MSPGKSRERGEKVSSLPQRSADRAVRGVPRVIVESGRRGQAGFIRMTKKTFSTQTSVARAWKPPAESFHVPCWSDLMMWPVITNRGFEGARNGAPLVEIESSRSSLMMSRVFWTDLLCLHTSGGVRLDRYVQVADGLLVTHDHSFFGSAVITSVCLYVW